MRRRRFLFAFVWAGFAQLLSGHTPYRQWKVFRQRFLLIMTTRADPEGDALGDRFVEVLAAELPQSRAMVSRTANLERIASLITTDQANVAVLAHNHALALARGDAPFVDYGPFPLRAVVEAGRHLLVCREDVPLHHGYLIAAALMEYASELGVRVPQGGADTIPTHPGAAAYARGEQIEPPP